MGLLGLFGGRRGYRLTFDALPPSVTAALGTLGVAGGKLVATGIAANGKELLTNGSMEDGDPPTGWTPYSVSATVDGVADERTGGAGAQSLAVTLAVATSTGPYQNVATVVGASYGLSGWRRNIDAAAGIRLGLQDVGSSAYFYEPALITGTTWEQGSGSGVAVSAASRVRTLVQGAIGQSGRFDDLSCQRQNAIAWMPPVGVNLSLPVALAMPAAPDVTPIDIIVRGADALNYWAVRLTPNTAGNDTSIIEVVAGVETVRAAADVDWTASGIDYVLLDVRGPALTVYAMKQGASVWTAAAFYATMATQLTSTGIGVQYYSTTAGPTLTDWAPRAS